MTIDCAFFGFLAADADSRTAKNGKAWTKVRIGVGKGEDVQWLSVACFGRAAENAAQLRKGDRIYCEGTLRLDKWQGKDGVERHGLSVTSFLLEATHQIGRRRRERDYPDESPVDERPPDVLRR